MFAFLMMNNVAPLTPEFRGTGPTVFAQVKNGVGMDEIISLIIGEWRASGAEKA